jgi:hypothetical protein
MGAEKRLNSPSPCPLPPPRGEREKACKFHEMIAIGHPKFEDISIIAKALPDITGI